MPRHSARVLLAPLKALQNRIAAPHRFISRCPDTAVHEQVSNARRHSMVDKMTVPHYQPLAFAFDLQSIQIIHSLGFL
jgi:hypothetical protein